MTFSNIQQASVLSKTNQEAGHALVLGASGSIGSTITQRLLQQGWQVTALKRDLTGIASDNAVNWVQGDALNKEDVLKACQGCDVIIHAVNPAGYRDWDKLVLPMLENTLQAALHHRACIVIPGNVYNFSADAGTDIKEDIPQQPISKKGRIRVAMEHRLSKYTQQGGRCILVRCGDFFGPDGYNSWLDQGIAPKGINSKRLFTLSKQGIGHQWAYLPDVAEVMMQLILRRDELPSFACYHMAGHWDNDGRQIVQAAAKVIASHRGNTPRIQKFPWWMIYAAALFNTTCKELLEMRYLWQRPLRMNNEKLTRVIGEEPHTPLEDAISATLAVKGR